MRRLVAGPGEPTEGWTPGRPGAHRPPSPTEGRFAMADDQPSIPRLGQWTRPPLPGPQNGRSGSPQLKNRDDVSRTDRYLSAAGIARPNLNRDRRFCAESEPQA